MQEAVEYDVNAIIRGKGDIDINDSKHNSMNSRLNSIVKAKENGLGNLEMGKLTCFYMNARSVVKKGMI